MESAKGGTEREETSPKRKVISKGGPMAVVVVAEKGEEAIGRMKSFHPRRFVSENENVRLSW